jgi:drug/metabolite transporter (DMT)-like permease
MALGYVFFDDRPDRYMLLGASFIVLSGLYAFYRERQLASTRPAASASALPPEGV